MTVPRRPAPVAVAEEPPPQAVAAVAAVRTSAPAVRMPTLRIVADPAQPAGAALRRASASSSPASSTQSAAAAFARTCSGFVAPAITEGSRAARRAPAIASSSSE